MALLRRKLAARTLGALAMAALLAAPALAQSGKFTFRVMTFNVRFEFESDIAEGNAWKSRCPIIAETVKQAKVSVVCFQEDKQNQVDDLRAALSGWEFKGKGRDNKGSEHCAIAFDTSVWSCVESGDFWLSDTPDVPASNTWGTKYPHKVTWARLQPLKSHQQVMFLSTHFDETRGGDEVRRKSAECIRTWLQKHCPKGEIVQCGDFNSAVTDPSHEVMTAAGPGQQLRDVFDVVHPPEPSPGTCHEFKGVAGTKRIDWILTAGKIAPVSLKIDHYSKNGHFPSDHFAVWAELDLVGAGASSSTTRTPIPEPQVK